MSHEFDVMPGNKAVAYGVKLARVEVVPAYPITPQTTIIEYIADFVANGELKAEYIHTDGEHSCMGAAVGASLTGARTFTATCSQGLAYMHEIVAQATGYRTPMVMAVANRTLGWYWALGPDYSDVQPELNLGWIVNFVESNQECLDLVLQLYKVAEDRRVMLPAMMNLDGFYLSYSHERVDIPAQEAVDAWLPPYDAPYPLDPTVNNKFPSGIIPATLHTMYRRLYEEVMEDAKKIIAETDHSYREAFGRGYGGLIERYRCDDAEALMVTTGSMTTATRRAVDRLRKQGERIGLVKVRFMRPFPTEEFRELAGQVEAIGVVDRMIQHGTGGGMIFNDLRAAVCNLKEKALVINFITGLGGEDVPIDDLYMMGEKTVKVASSGRIDKEVEFIEHPAPDPERPVEVPKQVIYPSSQGCAGCGSSIIIRHVLDVLGPDTVVVNPPSCSVVNYPGVTTNPWILANFAAGGAYATGVYRALKFKGKADKVYVTGYAGDGGTVDIGLQSLSGAAERGEPILWICYDNEAYMNTGIQRSGSTPIYSSTTSTPAGTVWHGKPTKRKNMAMVMAAHRIPYIATASLAYIPDLRRKVKRAAEVTRSGEGMAFIHVHQPCCTGWYYPPEMTVTIGRLAVQTGAWPVMEIDHGELRINVKPKELKPIAEYLGPQRRFGHMTEAQTAHVEDMVQKEWNCLLELERQGRLPWY
ncbi:MAG: thiamine pyrophosphate-dependent enzyme [Candidatus Bathyarchaeota archaeon]